MCTYSKEPDSYHLGSKMSKMTSPGNFGNPSCVMAITFMHNSLLVNKGGLISERFYFWLQSHFFSKL